MQAAAKAGLAYFTIVFIAGFLLGTLRVLLLAPMLGELIAVLIELPIMIAISYFACHWLVRRFSIPAEPAPRLAMGAISFACLMASEAVLAVTLFGQSLPAFLATFSETPARLGLAGQVVFAFMPSIERLMHKR